MRTEHKNTTLEACAEIRVVLNKWKPDKEQQREEVRKLARKILKACDDDEFGF